MAVSQALILVVVLLLWVVAVVMCRFPPSMSLFTRFTHPIEQLKGGRILDMDIYIYMAKAPSGAYLLG